MITNDDYCDGDDMMTTMKTIMIKIRRDGHRQGGATLSADTRTSRAHSLFAHWTRNKWLVVIIMKMVMIMIMMLLFFVLLMMTMTKIITRSFTVGQSPIHERSCCL